MRRNALRSVLAVVVAVALWANMASADTYHVELDLSSLLFDTSVPVLGLDISLWDNNYDVIEVSSHVFVDNVVLAKDGVEIDADRFDGGLCGFFDPDFDPHVIPSWPSYVSCEDQMIRIDEDPLHAWTTAFRTYDLSLYPITSFAGTVLSFDVDEYLSDVPGFYGLDRLAISLFDESGWTPVASSFSPWGDVALIDPLACTWSHCPGRACLGCSGLARPDWLSARGSPGRDVEAGFVLAREWTTPDAGVRRS